ncbi:DFR1 [Candida pseudojiufengensis]|uniref:DFR1 n=1 Tax=Candida pseudojiufengensis TaxID=497109 RepID=UPI0022240D0A|nr:DFR1 [Candida pseudojiufengensis]KAI5959945.1 DFR1 [Candida pseudojiufengensis]
MSKQLQPQISVVVAALKPSYGIGYKGSLPWKLKKEMAFFKRVTTNTIDSSKRNAVIMGRKTWDSIPTKFRPLPNRLNVIISRSYPNVNIVDENVIQVNSIEESIEVVKNQKNIENIFIIGGAEIYNAFMNTKNLVDNLLITEIENSNEVIEMDTFLNFDADKWEKQSKTKLNSFINEEVEDDIEENNFKYNYTLWQKKN